MSRRMVLYGSFVSVLGLAGGLASQPLYLGEQEFDTADRDLMAAVIDRCAELATDRTRERRPADREGERTSTDTDGAGSPPDSATTINSDISIVDIGALASGGDAQMAAGEGAGPGVPSAGDTPVPNRPETTEITWQYCQEAGIVF